MISSKSSSSACRHMLQHLERIMYLSKRFTWTSCLEYHAAVLLSIEKGVKHWGSSFSDLEYFLCDLGASSNGCSDSSSSGSDSDSTRGSGIWYCNKYNKGLCTMGPTHSQYFFNKDVTKTVEHICSYCLHLDGSRRMHSYVDCPRR